MKKRKPSTDFPPDLYTAIIGDMLAYYRETNGHKRDAIAAVTLHRIKQHTNIPVKLWDIKDMFAALREENPGAG